MADGINYTGDLPRYVLDRLVDHLTVKSYLYVDDRSNVGMLRIIIRETRLKFQLSIFLNTLTMKYELRCG